MLIFNTLTQKKEEIRPRDGTTFRMFVCGPTVQDNVHLGHAKTYITFDVLARWLLKIGFKVDFLLNITDVDDKIFDRAKKENVPYMEIANKFFQEFIADMEALNIQTISRIERVSNFVGEAVSLVQTMVSSGTAYELDGDYYFDTARADHYGKLSHQSSLQLRLKQIDAAPGKKNSVDFLLWRKVAEGSDGVWDSPIGKGRPGWHIEDSAIAFACLKGPYDLHGGATELIFPHHESELAQDESCSGEIPFVSTWMHTGLLLKDGEKMSKSLGNMIRIKDAMASFDSDTIRHYFLKRHYRESYDIDLVDLGRSKDEVEIMISASKLLPKRSEARKDLKTLSEKELFRKFAMAMDDDLNTGTALRMLLKLSKEILENKAEIGESGPIFWHMVETLGFVLN